MPLPLAPYRQDKKIYPTPLVGDVLFSELVDTGRMVLPEYGTPHPNTEKWPNHHLVYIEEGNTDREGVFRFYYAAVRDAQDEYNFSHTKADIGGVKFDAVQRTYVIPRADYTELSPVIGSVMPDTPTGLFDNEIYILAERKQQRIGQQELDSMYVALECVYIKRTVLVQNDYDEAFGGNLFTAQTLYHIGETITVDGIDVAVESLFDDGANPFWGLQEGGFMREGRQLSANWFALTQRQVVPEDFATSGRTYYSTTDYSWPAVLEQIRVDNWELREGGEDRYVYPEYKREAYRGPCKMKVVETFHVTPPTDIVAPAPLLPLPIQIATPFLSFSDGPSLHEGDILTLFTGSNHPKYRATGGTYVIPGTSPTDWPSVSTGLLVSDDTKPFRGGYLRTKVTVYPPA